MTLNVFTFWTIFFPFYQPNNLKNKIKKKKQKKQQKQTNKQTNNNKKKAKLYENYMMYGVSDMEHDRQKFFLLWTIF